MKIRRSESGAVLLVGLVILMTAMAAALLSMFNLRMSEIRREQNTANSLAIAKQALLGYAWNAAWVDSAARNCLAFPPNGCARPGDLPCPDMHPPGDPNIGTPGTAAGACPQNAIGRLPWRTLGLPDLRDGYGERLWYARSERFRTRNRLTVVSGAGPLNPDTAFGQISVRSSDGGSFLHTAAANGGSGAVAVIIAPGAALTRNNGMRQDRSVANYNNATHYLDCWGTVGCNVEDNANFVSGSPANGFIMGPIRRQGRDVVNDRLIVIGREEILSGMNKAVANAVAAALEAFYAPRSYLPSPADFADSSCLGVGNLSTSCNSVHGITIGRIPVNLLSPPSIWTPVPQALILTGPNNRWFQQNGWREHVIYAIAPACANDSANCSLSGGLLTVANPPYAALSNKRATVIVGGAALTALSQSRLATPSIDKALLANYIEGENMTPLDSLFTKRPATPVAPFNDIVTPVPRVP